MKVITRTFENVTRADYFRIYDLSDIHIGPQACDENRLTQRVAEIAANPNAYWIGLGDNCDFINRSDPRFDPGELADWVKMSDLVDLPRAQVRRLLDILQPIAPKCLCMLKGNHEDKLTKYYERDVHLEVVNGIKDFAGWDAGHKLDLGYNGYLLLKFKRDNGSCKTLSFYLHHGFGGGKLAGGKALNMQRVLWTHQVNLAWYGHVHAHELQPQVVQGPNNAGNIVDYYRYGMIAGTFLRQFSNSDTYGEKAGYFPMAQCTSYVDLMPHTTNSEMEIKNVLYGPTQRIYKL